MKKKRFSVSFIMEKFKFTTKIPPLILIGTIIVLFPIFSYMTIDRINKQKAQSIRLLVEKSTALVRAFEAGAYTGMMNMGWSRNAMENLLRETASLPDISYLFIVNKDGTILAHNQKEKEGQTYGRDLDLTKIINSKRTGWRTKKDERENKVFEVYKKFSPVKGEKPNNSTGMMSMHQRMHGRQFNDADGYENTIIFVGLDMQLIDQADKGDTQHSILMAVILALIGFTGLILVFIVQRYAATRSSLSRIQIFSDNLVENMPVGLIATDTNKQIISVNPAAESILNIQSTRGRQNLSAALPGELESLLQSIDKEKNLVEKEIHIDGLKDQPIILEVIASPLYDKEGISLGSLLILRDKTELNRLKIEMEQNKRLAAIGRLAAGVAHEIRNPLSSLKGYATFFKEIFDKDTQNFDIADVMIKEVDRLNHVVSELVELAKPVTMSGKPINIQSLIQESIKLMGYEAEVKNIEIKTDLDPDVPQIYADTDRLKQVLLNLYLNAIQSMEGSGTLGIRLFQNQSDQNVMIAVSDTGTGIKKEDLPDIFEPYFTTKLSGTGLGLAIVHNIVKAHKGEINVKSDPEKGTSFTIILPDRGMDENE
ncbi:PAS domain-containing sensor histidine kinase [Desulfobacula sp.]|uniref:PAS domain-containing sensor histidine kinase n=1 Tax=Desulfobacula sp. TaxID=2593537 RepID=UPI00261B8001|nr:PAS domain-containing sensor histidine kinase [Desulfobacula sp.]